MIPAFLAAAVAAALLPATALITPAAASAPASAQGPTVSMQRELARIRDAERRRAEAVSSRDVATLRSLVGGEYYHVESNGRVRSKTEILQLLARDEFEFRSYEIDNMDVTLTDNGRTAIVTGRIVAQMQGPGRPREFRGRFIRVWTLEHDGWRNALHQVTEIKPAANPREARNNTLS